MTSEGRFQPGDHLKVRRPGYWHHGIYVGDGRVVQFGGSVFDKPHARIAEVPFVEFERRGRAERVDHDRLTWLGLWKLPDR
jgi:HRAS-like suppressor 3